MRASETKTAARMCPYSIEGASDQGPKFISSSTHHGTAQITSSDSILITGLYIWVSKRFLQQWRCSASFGEPPPHQEKC